MMRIDLLGAAAGIGVDGTTAARPGSGARSAAAPLPEDTATLSSARFSVPSLASQALASAEARGAKVEALRQTVASAQYTLDPAAIADAIESEGA